MPSGFIDKIAQSKPKEIGGLFNGCERDSNSRNIHFNDSFSQYAIVFTKHRDIANSGAWRQDIATLAKRFIKDSSVGSYHFAGEVTKIGESFCGEVGEFFHGEVVSKRFIKASSVGSSHFAGDVAKKAKKPESSHRYVTTNRESLRGGVGTMSISSCEKSAW